MEIKKNIILVCDWTINYLAITLRIAVPVLGFFYYFGAEIGDYLIEIMGDVYGLLVRPMFLSAIVVVFLVIMSNRFLNGLNRIYWFGLRGCATWLLIYKHYIYALFFFILINSAVILSTIALPKFTLLNWFSIREELFVFLLVMLFATPLYTIHSGSK